MSKLNQLLNIEVGTFKRQGNKLILELNHNQFRYDQLSELNELKGYVRIIGVNSK